jgi:hypothetical protein
MMGGRGSREVFLHNYSTDFHGVFLLCKTSFIQDVGF